MYENRNMIAQRNPTIKGELSALQRERTLQEGMILADKFVNRNYLINLCAAPVLPVPTEMSTHNGIRMFKINRFVYDYSENVNDKLISIYSALSELGIKAIIIIDGDATGVDFYVGVRSDANELSPQIASTAEEILLKGIKGNFPGSDLQKLRQPQIEAVFEKAVSSSRANTSKNVSSVSIIPSMRDEDKEKYVQGIEKFIDAMMGETYTAVLLATPLPNNVLEQRKRGFEELYSTLSSYQKMQLSYGTSYSEAVSSSMCENFSKSISNSISNTNSTFSSSGTSDTYSSSSGSSFGTSGDGSSFSSNSGSSSSSTSSYSSGESFARAITQGITEGESYGITNGDTKTKGISGNVNIDFENKSISGLLEKIDEHLKRISDCECFGLWESAGYFISNDVQTSVVAANTYKALMAGNDSGVENSFTNLWTTKDQENTLGVLASLKYGLHPCIQIKGSSFYDDQNVTPTCLVSGKDLPLFMGLPQRSVTGVTALEMAPFGRNVFCYSEPTERKRIHLGNVYHMGAVEKNHVDLDIDTLTSHCFICGSTGSGKSNTSYGLIEKLIDNGIKFMVIEPAKGEYKRAFGKLPNINVFCTNYQYFRMLKINPFKFPARIHVLEHIDRLVEIFNACWPMFAAMPAILKSGIERAYMSCGWDLNNSVISSQGSKIYPTFQDLLEQLPLVIKQSGYSANSQSDYIGALVTRVKSMTNGIYGQIFCDVFDIDDAELFDANTIVDLSRVGSVETKSLLMGILVLKLNEYRMSNAVSENLPLKHVTILEEAHNLLKRTSTEQNIEGANLQGKSVEMISQSIAEMRTYGEGFIIIDQSPTSVDISAIKNTNTKIIMRLPEIKDCEAVGNSVSIDENQLKELPKLPTGVAVVYQNNWLEAVLCKIDFRKGLYRYSDVVCTLDEIFELRNCVLIELLHFDISRKNFSDERIQQIYRKIDECSINRFKKDEMKASVKSIYNHLRFTNGAQTAFAEAVAAITSASMVFDIVPLPDTNNSASVRKWYEEIKCRLQKNYIGNKIGKSKVYKLVIQYLIWYRRNDIKRSSELLQLTKDFN